MITSADFYHVMTAVVPLYVAMILGYGSVKWWKFLTPVQCSGINRFVAVFAVPLLSFHFIASNDPYAINLRFIAADTLQKLIVLGILALWTILTKTGCLKWTITLFSLSSCPNTLVIGIPLFKGMYGDFAAGLMVQILVVQHIIWNTLLLLMLEYRASKMLISEQITLKANSDSVRYIHVDSDLMSLDGRHPLGTEAEIKEDGELQVNVRKSNTSRSDSFSRRSMGFSSTTPGPSNLTNAEIYSLPSSGNPTPRGSSFNHTDFDSMMGGGRNSNFDANKPRFYHGENKNNDKNTNYPGMFSPTGSVAKKDDGRDEGGKDLHMFFGSSSACPVSDVFGGHDYGALDQHANAEDVRGADSPVEGLIENQEDYNLQRDEFSFGNGGGDGENGGEKVGENQVKVKVPASVVTRLILIMVWRKLKRNPNNYSSLIGLIWSLVSFRWHIEMPAIIAKSISILSDASLGMAMFSLGLFMAMYPMTITRGNAVVIAFAMAVRLLTGPAVMAAASVAVGLRGVILRIAIVQAALPQGIVPFVLAKEYNVHPGILGMGVIFGKLIALPITLVYYILLGL